jgi:hypothetical protein
MPDIAQMQPQVAEPESDRLRKQAALSREMGTPGFGDLGTAALEQTFTASAFNRIGASPLLWEPDPKFQWTDKLFKELSDGMDPAAWPQLADAVSYPHAAFIANMDKNRQKFREQLGSAGVGGTAASIVASLADPAFVAATVASGGLASVGSAGKIAQLTRAGLLTGAAFASMEEFKQAGDPTIRDSDVLLAGAMGLTTAVAGGLTEGLPRSIRFPVGGLAAAAPGTAYAALTSDEQNQSRDIMLNFLPQFFLGGAMTALHPTGRSLDGVVDTAARGAMKDQEFDLVKQQAEALGKKPSEVLSDPGKAYFNQQLSDYLDGGLARLSKSLNAGEPNPEHFDVGAADWESHPLVDVQQRDRALEPYRIALDRLSKMDPEKRLNREEADAALEGTAWKTANQGFPTVDDMKGYVRHMMSKIPLTPEDGQRILAQQDYASPIVRTSPPPEPPSMELPKPPVPEPKSGEELTAMGAAAANDPVFKAWADKAENVRKFQDLDLSGTPRENASGARFSMAGMASRSESDDIAWAANMMGRDDLPKGKGVAAWSAREQTRDRVNAKSNELLHTNTDAYKAYAAAEHEAGRTPLPFDELQNTLGRQYRQNAMPTGNEHMDRMLATARKIRKDNLEYAQRAGVRGAIETQWDPTLLDRHTVRDKLDNAIKAFGMDQVVKWAHEDVASHPENADLSEKQHLALARDWLLGAGRQGGVIDAAEANHMQLSLPDFIAGRLREIDSSLTPEEIEGLIWKKAEVPEGEGTGAGNPPRFRRQTRMETSTVHEAADGRKFSFDDVIDQNLERIVLSNSQQLNGLAGMAEVYRQFSTPERPIESMPQLKLLLAERAVAQGINSDAIKADLDRIDMMAKIIQTGGPGEQNTPYNRALRTLRNLSFIRLINPNTSLRNSFEMAGAMAEHSLGTMLRAMPDIGDFFEATRGGKADNQLARELTEVGIAMTNMNRRVMPGPEEGDIYAPPKTVKDRLNDAMRATDKGLRIASNFVSKVSFLAAEHSIRQKVVGKFIAQKWFDAAQSGRLPNTQRLAAMGMDEPMARRIIDQINGENGAAFEKSAFGKRLTGFNWSQWEDVEAAAHLRQAISKTASRLAFIPDPTQMGVWMQKPTARAMIQFKHWALGSYESKTLFNLKMNDSTAYVSYGAQMLGKAISYTLATYLYSLARPDKEKYLRDRLSTGTIAKAAFAQADFASLIPTAVDAMMAARGRSPFFAFARTTGLGQGGGGVNPSRVEAATAFLTQSAPLDTLSKMVGITGVGLEKVFGFAGHTLDSSYHYDPRFNQADARTVAGGLPMQNFWGIKQAIQAGINQFAKPRK